MSKYLTTNRMTIQTPQSATPRSRSQPPAAQPVTRAAGKPYRNVAEARSVSMLGLGMIIGAAIGAGVALLAAPRSGEETRDRIRDRVRHVRGDYTLWEKLGRELKRASSLRRKRELMRRKQEEEQLAEKERAERDARVTPE